MRAFLFTIFIMIIFACSHDKPPIITNPVDSTAVIPVPGIAAPDTGAFVFSCGTTELMRKMNEAMNWSNKYEKQMICSEYAIREKGFDAFIDRINRTDSFHISNFEPPWVDWTRTKGNGTDSSENNDVSVTCFPENVYILKTTSEDSIPLKISFTADYDGNITMKMCTDTSVSKLLSGILTGGHLATRIDQVNAQSK